MGQAADEKIKGAVRQAYGTIARRFNEGTTENTVTVAAPARTSCCGQTDMPAGDPIGTSCCEPADMAAGPPARASCCGPSEASPAVRFYSDEELAGLPESVTGASLGCGNPIAIASLQPGEVVLDLGSGGGIDCFLAAERVGPQGRVIGLDMTTDMIKLARRNAKKIGAANVDFRYGEMEDIPLPDGSVDVVISNCVINLSPDKDAVFRETFRVLRPGGRLSVSDIVVDGQLPSAIRNSLNAWAGCIAGALDESDYLARIRNAGFGAVEVLSRDYADLEETTEWEDVQALLVQQDGELVDEEEVQAFLEGMGLSPHDLAHKVASIKVTAHKPV